MTLKSLMFLFSLVTISLVESCKNNIIVPPTVNNNAWNYIGLENESIVSLGLDPTNPNIIYAGSYYDFELGVPAKLFKSIDAGKTWDTLLTMNNAQFLGIVVDPNNPQIIYAAPWGIIKSNDGGSNWEEMDNGIQTTPGETHVGAISMDPFNSNVLYAGTGGPQGGRLYKTTDAGAHWNIIGGDSLMDGITSIAINQQNNNIIYAGTAGRGILWKSTDAGENWRRTGLGETGLIIASILIDSTRLYVGISPNNGPYDIDPYYGVWKSNDGGNNWKSFNQGFVQGSGVMEIAKQKSSQTLYMVMSSPNTSPTPTIDNLGGVYKRSSATGFWEQIGIDTVSDYYSSVLKISPDDNFLYFGGRGIYRLKLR